MPSHPNARKEKAIVKRGEQKMRTHLWRRPYSNRSAVIWIRFEAQLGKFSVESSYVVESVKECPVGSSVGDDASVSQGENENTISSCFDDKRLWYCFGTQPIGDADVISDVSDDPPAGATGDGTYPMVFRDGSDCCLHASPAGESVVYIIFFYH